MKSGYTDDNKHVNIRITSEDDAAALVSLKKSYIKGTTSIPMYEHEYTNTIEQEAELINRYNMQKNSVLLVAECEGKLIGNIDLTGNQREKLFHTAMLGMGIANDWQNKKIGSLLMESALAWATDESPVEIVWLEVYSTNLPGRKLYEKFGFEHCGMIQGFFRDEVTADKITMVKHLHYA